MSLTIKHLNGDASFLLTFRPIAPFPPSPGQADANAFSIVLDPWLSGTSNILHPIFSSTRQKDASCISSLLELPEPDLVIISQNMPDHCHKKTLKQLPPHLGKTRILAPAEAAGTINGWKYFDPSKVVALRKWEHRKQDRLFRIALPPLGFGGEPGEVTIAYVEDSWNKDNMARVHNAIGITYTPPTYEPRYMAPTFSGPMTPPVTPSSSTFFSNIDHFPSSNKPLSVIFSPHGCDYSTLSSYSSTHLHQIGALPLTALLHCFDEVRNTWYLGGRICNGMPGGVGIAQNLRARVWISAHDADKVVKGFSTKLLEIKKFDREEVEAVVSPRTEAFQRGGGTRAVVLGSGEEMVLSQVVDWGSPQMGGWI